jgi:hypothetical protein
MARLYSNENFPLPVVERLRVLGRDVLTIQKTVDWSGLPCEARFWDWKLGPAKPHYL